MSHRFEVMSKSHILTQEGLFAEINMLTILMVVSLCHNNLMFKINQCLTEVLQHTP